VHLPVLILFVRALRGDGGGLGVRVEAEREVAEDVLDLARVDVLLLELAVRVREVASAEGALVVGEFDDRDLRGSSSTVAGVSGAAGGAGGTGALGATATCWLPGATAGLE
jgi:hypothetical protein